MRDQLQALVNESTDFSARTPLYVFWKEAEVHELVHAENVIIGGIAAARESKQLQMNKLCRRSCWGACWDESS